MYSFLMKYEFRRFRKIMKNIPGVFLFYLVFIVGGIGLLYPLILQLHNSDQKFMEIVPYFSLLMIIWSIYSNYFRKYPIIKLDSATYYLFVHTRFFNKAVRYYKIKNMLISFIMGVVFANCVCGFKISFLLVKYVIAFTFYLIAGSLTSWIIYQEKKRIAYVASGFWSIITLAFYFLINTTLFMIFIITSVCLIYIYTKKMEINHEKYLSCVEFMTLSIDAVSQYDELAIKEVVVMDSKKDVKFNEKIFTHRNVLAEKSLLFLLRTQKKFLVVLSILPIIIFLCERILITMLGNILPTMLFQINTVISYLLINLLVGILKLPINEIIDKQKGGLLYLLPKRKIIVSTLVFPGGLLVSLYAILLEVCLLNEIKHSIIFLLFFIVYYICFYMVSVMNKKVERFANIILNVAGMLLLIIIPQW